MICIDGSVAMHRKYRLLQSICIISGSASAFYVYTLMQNAIITCLYSTVTNCAPQSHVSVSTVTLCAFSNRWIITSQRLHPNFHLGAAEGSSTRIPRSHSKQLDKPFEFILCGHVGCVHELQPLIPFFMSLKKKHRDRSLESPFR